MKSCLALNPKIQLGGPDDWSEKFLKVFCGVKTTPQPQEFSSTGSEPSMEELVKSGVVCSFFHFVDRGKLLFEFEAAGTPTSVNSGASEPLNYVIGRGAALKLVQLYKSSRDEFQQLGLWAFGNTIGDLLECCAGHADVFDEFFLALDMSIDGADLPGLRNVSRTLYSFCVDLDPDFPQKGRVHYVLRKLVHCEDVEVLRNACWALANSFNDTVDDIQAVILSGVRPRLADLLTCHTSSILIPVLISLGKLVSGTDEQTQFFINQDVLSKLSELLINFDNASILKLSCFIIATITSQCQEHVQAVMNANLMPPLINLLKGKTNCEEDALLAIFNCATKTTPQQITWLFDDGCIELLCRVLSSDNPVIIERCLNVLDEILKVKGVDTAAFDGYRQIIEDVGGLYKLKKLLSYESNVIVNAATKLLRKYWLEEDC